MRDRKHAPLAIVLAAVLLASACGDDKAGSPSGPSVTSPNLTAPALESPGSNEEVGTLRPTLTVRNGGSDSTGTRTYDFQVSTSSSFTPVAVMRLYVPENASGKTSYTLEQDLQPKTAYYWRSRVAQDGRVSEWSTNGQFKTKEGGYNRAGELFDPLFTGSTVGERVGSTTFVPGKGLRIDNVNSYVRYLLPRTMSTGYFSMDVEGIYVNGPDVKMKIFSMMEGLGTLTNNRFEAHAQYRGVAANPDNCITFKAVWGSPSIKLEPPFDVRAAGVRSLNASTTYHWEGSWNQSGFRLMVREGGISGSVIYDLTINAPAGAGQYAPDPHYVFLGANSGEAGSDTGSWPGAVYRNVWLSDRPRPASMNQ